ncbi:hypothetical protein C8R44DRAFT_72406 [Mycena epipterygia]|nr:hypothetical protein C8R44DRAFT_72406 [Mycena epipterygia]
MSSGDPRMVIHSDVAYATNRERIEKMQEFINRANAINEQGKRNYDQISNELKRKIQEGEEAQRMLAALQSSTPLLTYHDSELQPPTSTSNVPLLSFPPTYVSPVPSARIEEVPSPDRHHQPNTQQSNNQQSSSYYQPTYASNYDARFYSGNSNYQPYEQSRPSSHFSNQTAQNAPGSSTLQNALGQHAQAQQSYHLRTAPQQTAESSSRQTYSQPREIIIPQQSQPYSYSQQRDPNVSGVAHSNSGPQTQSRRSAPPASQSYSQQEVHPQAPQPNVQSQVPSQRPPAAQSQFSILSFGAATQLNSQQSQPRQTPPAAASRQSSSAPGMQPPRQSPAPPNPRVETQSQSGPSAPPVWSTHPNLRPQAQPQNQSSLLPTQLHVPSQPQQSVPLAQSDSRSQQREAQPPGAGSQRPEQKENQSSTSKQSLYKPSVVPTAAAPTPSYGISPFAHIPTSIQKANPSVVPSQKPTAPNGQLPKPSSKQAVLAAAAATMTAAQYEGFKVFLNIVNAWQKASPPEAYMDIPHAHIRVDKLPIGEIHFSNSKLRKGPLARLSPATAFLNLQFSGNARIFVNTKGVSMLLQEPLPAAMKPTFPQFEGKPVKDAPEATFPEPPPSTQPGKRVLSNSDSGRSPHDADKRFIAHDILRALGKGHLFAADEESLRYAKRRALEAPEPASSMFVAAPFVPRPVGSNESSAKTTPASSRSPSVASAPQRVPLFLDSSPPPMPIAVSFVKPERRRSPNDRPTSPDFYVLVPAAPAYVRRHQAKIRGEREAKELPVEVEVVEEEKEPEIDVTELKRRRALGMKQSLKACRVEG